MDPWNALDLLYIVGLFVWMISRFGYYSNESSVATTTGNFNDALEPSSSPSLIFYWGKAGLALSAIPLTLSLLQFMSMSRNIGELGIM